MSILKNFLSIVSEILEIFLFIFAFSWFLSANMFDFARVNDQGMLPALNQGNQLLVGKLIYYQNASTLKRGDIVAYKSNNKTVEIKRVIGKTGEKVEVRNGFTYINDKPFYEPYAHTPLEYTLSPETVPPENILVLNDNRSGQNKNSNWELVPKKNILGKALICFWPWQELKSL